MGGASFGVDGRERPGPGRAPPGRGLGASFALPPRGFSEPGGYTALCGVSSKRRHFQTRISARSAVVSRSGRAVWLALRGISQRQPASAWSVFVRGGLVAETRIERCAARGARPAPFR